jgi:hypothetical protein
VKQKLENNYEKNNYEKNNYEKNNYEKNNLEKNNLKHIIWKLIKTLYFYCSLLAPLRIFTEKIEGKKIGKKFGKNCGGRGSRPADLAVKGINTSSTKGLSQIIILIYIVLLFLFIYHYRLLLRV